MGYSEVYCAICETSFNIGRVRRPDETTPQGWDGHGSKGFVVSLRWKIEGCLASGGCQFLVSNRRGGEEIVPLATEGERIIDESGSEFDLDFDENEDVDMTSEPYEYDDILGTDEEDDDLVDEPEDEEEGDENTDSDELYQQAIRSLKPSCDRDMFSCDYDMFPLAKDTAELRPITDLLKTRDRERMEMMEHIAGPQCSNLSGYNGYNISVEEMRGCHTSQCLVPKPTWWRPEDDDEDFEKEGRHFLSGLSDEMPSRDMDFPRVFPERHECPKPVADNIFCAPDQAAATAFPFHPTCLEVFKRVYFRRLGKMDWKALSDWFTINASRPDHDETKFAQHPALRRAGGSEWEHNSGDEFLAANPCFPPALPKILSEAISNDIAELDYHRGAFDVSASETRSKDTFSNLPFELRVQILDKLGLQDIAALRIASRTFRQLPQSVFHSLIVREMPWLWEAWCNMDYSKWALSTAHELKNKYEIFERRQRDMQDVVDVLSEDNAGSTENKEALSAFLALVEDEHEKFKNMFQPLPAPSLSATDTNWLKLACDLRKNWRDLKGLQNRERIWQQCENIVSEIEKWTKEGRIGTDVEFDFHALGQRYLRR